MIIDWDKANRSRAHLDLAAFFCCAYLGRASEGYLALPSHQDVADPVDGWIARATQAELARRARLDEDA